MSQNSLQGAYVSTYNKINKTKVKESAYWNVLYRKKNKLWK
jgi:hypothetical protein